MPCKSLPETVLLSARRPVAAIYHNPPRIFRQISVLACRKRTPFSGSYRYLLLECRRINELRIELQVATMRSAHYSRF